MVAESNQDISSNSGTKGLNCVITSVSDSYETEKMYYNTNVPGFSNNLNWYCFQTIIMDFGMPEQDEKIRSPTKPLRGEEKEGGLNKNVMGNDSEKSFNDDAAGEGYR